MASATDAAPPPTFDALPLSSEVRRAIDDLGYVHPTPVQRAVFEPASRGRDLVVQARTGTGKTAAFGLPLVDAIVRRKDASVQALVLCPTRELALQVTRELDALAKHRGTRVVAVYGGAPMPRQIEQIRAGAQILVGTPGRVLDHLGRRTLDPSAIRAVVLDESDEMLSMGFLPQINEIFSHLPEQRQTLLFSATLPADIRRMAETRLRNAEFITLSGDHIGALEIQHFVYLSRGDKVSELVQIIESENPESAIIFCNTRDETKRVAAELNQQGYAADWLNADLPQNDRERVMAATREGKLRGLVCTAVA
jgi:ATP-dependent RNA helicase DeaD